MWSIQERTQPDIVPALLESSGEIGLTREPSLRNLSLKKGFRLREGFSEEVMLELRAEG